MRMDITADDMIPDDELLPIEEEKVVNGIPKLVQIQYASNITFASQETSRSSGNKMLKLTNTISNPATGRMVNIDDYLSYSKAAMKVPGKNIGHMFDIFKMDKNNPDTDDFLDRWVWVTIRREENKGKTPDPKTGELPTFINNKIDRYIRELTVEELNQIKGGEIPI